MLILLIETSIIGVVVLPAHQLDGGLLFGVLKHDSQHDDSARPVATQHGFIGSLV
jgi:hypothetical protein